MAAPLSLFLITIDESVLRFLMAEISSFLRLGFSLGIVKLEISLKMSFILFRMGAGVRADGGVHVLLGVNGSFSPLRFFLWKKCVMHSLRPKFLTGS